jgi:pimeloyl-ACP methyl ester carboxylesterase
VPTLVLHGADDPMCDVSGGRATAAAIPGAELVVLDGMGHDLPRALWPEITSRIAGVVQRVEPGAAVRAQSGRSNQHARDL